MLKHYFRLLTFKYGTFAGIITITLTLLNLFSIFATIFLIIMAYDK